ncbi:MAG: glucokinase [Phycisphaerales bacterium]|nr:glucokinase [Phycisphaerales bacterium]
MVSLGIDIGGTSVKVASLDGDGRVLWTGKSRPFARPDTAQLVGAIRQAVEGHDTAADAIGLCCPGLLDRNRRLITLSVNVPGLVDVPLDELVARALGAWRPSATILSDAGAVGFDIYMGRGLSGRLLCLALGTGVGASVIDEGGRFLHVSGESPGHFGQLDVSLDDAVPIGPDGGAGSLEAYIGAAALAARYGGAEGLAQLTAADPPVRALVRAIRVAHAIYRPQHVCLTGGVGIRLNPLVEQIKAAVEKDLTRVARAGWTLTTGESDYHAACGVARFAMRKDAE